MILLELLFKKEKTFYGSRGHKLIQRYYFFFKQKTVYEIGTGDWSSDVCSSDLIMGDVSTGLMIGGTFQLMSLGVAALGGASAPNYGLATIIGTFIAVRTGTGIDAAIAVGLPVVGIAMLMRYMPVKKFLPFILIGFVLSAYLNVPVLGIAIVGFAAAFGYFKIQLEKAEA